MMHELGASFTAISLTESYLQFLGESMDLSSSFHARNLKFGGDGLGSIPANDRQILISSASHEFVNCRQNP
jgi:hypothetical protein